MAELFATIGGVLYPLFDGTYALWTGEDGTGMPPLHRLTERGPLQHGDSDVDFRLDPRIIRERFTLNPATIAEHYDMRAALLAITRPSRTPIEWSWVLNNGATRNILGHVVNGPTFGSQERAGFSQKCVIEIRCDDPVFYDPVLIPVIFGVTGGTGAWAIPWAIPWGIGSSTVNQTTNITMPGSWLTYPTITIAGPITNPVITNLSTGDVLDFTGATIAALDSYTIDLRYRYKTVTNAVGANKIADLVDASDLATWSLQSAPEVAGGVNVIQVTGSAATSATQIYLRYYNRYIGL